MTESLRCASLCLCVLLAWQLADFGLAKLQGVATTTASPNTQNAPITTAYTAPEVFDSDGSTRDEKSDVYSLGVVFCEIATRQAPWSHCNGSFAMIKEAVTKGRRPRLSPSVAPGLSAVIERCWAPNPQDRPTAAEALNALRRLVRLRAASVRLPIAGSAGSHGYHRRSTSRAAQSMLYGSFVLT